MAKEPRIKSPASYELKRARKAQNGSLELTQIWTTNVSAAHIDVNLSSINGKTFLLDF